MVTTSKMKFYYSLLIVSISFSCKKQYNCTCQAATQSNGFTELNDNYTIKKRKKEDAQIECAKKSQNYDNIVGTNQGFGNILFVNCGLK